MIEEWFKFAPMIATNRPTFHNSNSWNGFSIDVPVVQRRRKPQQLELLMSLAPKVACFIVLDENVVGKVRIAIFLRSKSKWTKSKAKDSLLEILFGMDVVEALEPRKNEYVNLLKDVIAESDCLSRDASKLSATIKDLRERCKHNKSFVSVDVDIVHRMAQKERAMLDYKKKLKLAKSMFKTALSNFAKFAIRAEQSTHDLNLAEKTMKSAMDSIESMI